MKFVRYISILLAFWMLIPGYSLAAGYTLYGAGSGSCGEWISERKEHDWYNKGQWMLGVISAIGYYDVHDLKGVDSDALAGWADNYCRANPLSDFSEAVYALVEKLRVTNR